MAEALPFAMAGLQLAGGVAQGIGAISAGNAQAAAGAENARIMSGDSVRLEQTAGLLQQQGVTAASRVRQQGAAYTGSTITAYAGAGVATDVGSPLEVMSRQAGETEFQAQQAKFQFDQQAWQKQVEAYDLYQRAILTMRYGGQTQAAGYGAAAGADIGGIAKAGGYLLDKFGPAPASAAASAGAGQQYGPVAPAAQVGNT
jgi:hypothetical protein